MLLESITDRIKSFRLIKTLTVIVVVQLVVIVVLVFRINSQVFVMSEQGTFYLNRLKSLQNSNRTDFEAKAKVKHFLLTLFNDIDASNYHDRLKMIEEYSSVKAKEQFINSLSAIRFEQSILVKLLKIQIVQLSMDLFIVERTSKGFKVSAPFYFRLAKGTTYLDFKSRVNFDLTSLENRTAKYPDGLIIENIDLAELKKAK